MSQPVTPQAALPEDLAGPVGALRSPDPLTDGVRDEPGAPVRHPRSRDLLLETLAPAPAEVQWSCGRSGVREPV